jgi:hypothetical protein
MKKNAPKRNQSHLLLGQREKAQNKTKAFLLGKRNKETPSQ